MTATCSNYAFSKVKARDMMEGEEEEAGAGRKEEQEHIFSEIVKVSLV